MKPVSLLTLKEIVTILSETNVRHKFRPMIDNSLVMGYADYNNRLIVVDSALTSQTKKYVLLHEMFHMSDYLRGLDTNEKYTEKRTQNQYRRMYGNKFELG